MTGILTWLAGKTIPWKAIGIGLAALAVVGAITAGYLYVDGLQTDLAQTKAELATEKTLRELANKRAEDMKAQHDAQIEKLQQLETTRSAIDEENTNLRDQVRALETEKEMTDDPQKGAAAFAARAHQLNRLLESVSRNERPADRNRNAP